MSAPSPASRPLFRKPLRTIARMTLFLCIVFMIVQVLCVIFRLQGGYQAVALLIFRQICAFAALAVSVWYGVWRVSQINPLASGAYRNWLDSTPWDSTLNLPRGPIWIVWEDTPLILFLTALSWWGGLGLAAPILMAIAYSMLSMLLVRAKYAGFVTLWLWATLVLFYDRPTVVTLLLCLIIVVISVAQHRALRRLPWAMRVSEEEAMRVARMRETRWPMNPIEPKSPMHWTHGILWPALAGWWTFCLLAIQPELARWNNSSFSVLPLTILGAVMVGLGRYVVYCAEYQPPISTLGRIFAGYAFIPRYDVALLAPIAITSVGSGVAVALWKANCSPVITASVSAVIILLMALNLGPSKGHWQLTGAYRFVPGKQSKKPKADTVWNRKLF